MYVADHLRLSGQVAVKVLQTGLARDAEALARFRREAEITSALSHHLTKPGLDVRRAFGFVRDEVLKTTGNKQEPFVYGSLGGDDVPLVPAGPGERLPGGAGRPGLRPGRRPGRVRAGRRSGPRPAPPAF